MSIWFNSVKKYYDMGIYTNGNVGTFVKANMVTATEYKDITGIEYVV